MRYCPITSSGKLPFYETGICATFGLVLITLCIAFSLTLPTRNIGRFFSEFSPRRLEASEDDDYIVVTPRYDDPGNRTENSFFVNTTWMKNFKIYTPENRTTNNGDEFGMYFQYLCDEYPNFPERVYFVHGKDMEWHQVGTTENQIRRHRHFDGFVQMNTDGRGCWNGPLWRSETMSYLNKTWADDWWAETMEAYFGNKSDTGKYGAIMYGQPCCGTFALSKKRILSKPKAFYCDHIKFLLKRKNPGRWDKNNDFALYEYTIALMFGDNILNMHEHPPCANVKHIYDWDLNVKDLN